MDGKATRRRSKDGAYGCAGPELSQEAEPCGVGSRQGLGV